MCIYKTGPIVNVQLNNNMNDKKMKDQYVLSLCLFYLW